MPVANDDAPRGYAVTASGPTDCGKSRLLWRRYVARFPRKLTLDVVPETHKLDAGATCTFGFTETVTALHDLAARKSWHVIAGLTANEIERLFWILAPANNVRGAVSYARAVGGLAVFCGELRHFAARPLTMDSPVRDAYQRGRHHWLSVFGATQHISDCDPCVRMQAKHLVFFQQHDRLGLQAIRNASSDAIAERVRELELHHSITWVGSEARGYVLNAEYEVTDVINHRGESVTRPESAGALAGVPLSARTNGVRHSATGGNSRVAS